MDTKIIESKMAYSATGVIISKQEHMNDLGTVYYVAVRQQDRACVTVMTTREAFTALNIGDHVTVDQKDYSVFTVENPG